MHVWAVANQKGGVGKTTTAVNLGALLAEQGKRVLLFDLDPQGSMTAYFKYNPDALQHSSYDLFCHKGQIPEYLPQQIIVDTPHAGLQLLPASTALATLERNISQQDGMGLVVSKTLALLWDDFDYVLIDSPPLLGVLMINALAACARLLIPVQTEYLALKGLERMVHTLDMVMKSRQKSFQYLIIPTMFDRRTQASLKCLRMLKQDYDDRVWNSMIPVDTKLRDASKEGLAINAIDPNSRAAQKYRSLLETLKNGG
ncbi:ParA family protein [Gynuella sp.]|uniref:ParA family protein n=1 Tax=Gynuella sp. TaxID=2969146 RepID=UPI003D14D7F4